MRPPVRATYRLQLRNGVTFAEAAALAPQLARAGISHVYASPIFRAVAGSTHGYDVADHTVIDPALGGEAGFFAFSSALKAHGLGLILDIVPNHMAAHSDNPWWRDVLRHGPSSRYARHFDIDWTAQTLTLPILGKPYGEALADGDMARATHPEWGEGLAVAGQHLPLAPGTEHLSDVHACHEAQPYRVTHWRLARDGLTYRRFFEIAGLVGVRVEEPHVFDDVHRLVQTLVEDGHVSGLRVDHVDGLADPAAYLTRLSTLGVPVWVEKILGEDEGLPPWPVVGTTGYEFMAALHAAFVDEAGLAHLSAAYDAIAPAAYGAMEAAAKHRIATVNLAGEFASLETMARTLFASDMSARDHGPDTIRRGLIALSCALPVYRTYITGTSSEADRGHVEAARLAAAIGNLDERRVVDDLAALIVRGGAEEAPFVARWQQTTGPLMAKAVEDTLFFRHHRLIALNEVGSHPSAPLRVHNLDKALASPGLATTQTHDTKRGPDARARLYQLTHPDAARWWDTFWPTVGGGVSPSWQWALAQMWLGALPLDHDPTFKARFCAAVEKSAREAKEDTSWTRHNLAFESMLRSAAAELADREPDATVRRIQRAGAVTSIAQAILKCFGCAAPDIYQGGFMWDLSLVDPDNRRPVPFDEERALCDGAAASNPADLTRHWENGAIKARALMEGVALRRRLPALFAPTSQFRRVSAPHMPVIAYVRAAAGRAALCVVPRAPYGAVAEQGLTLDASALGPVVLHMPVALKGLFAGEVLGPGPVDVAPLLGRFPAILATNEPSS